MKKEDVYGMRRYLLLPRQSISLASSSTYGNQSSISSVEDVALLEQKAIASINANANVLFGARLHNRQNTNNDDEYEYNSQYFFACGTLLDIAKEDASINGQQVQALATLDGLCSWVRKCLSNNGHGSTVLTGLMHGYSNNNKVVDDDSNCSADTSLEEEEERSNNNSLNKSAATTKTTTSSALRSGKKKRSVSIIDPSSSSLLLPFMDNEKNNQRQKIILNAITAIATGKPRKGHSIIGAGTYRDGMVGWMALSREYAQLSSSSGVAVSNETAAAAATINDQKVDVDDNDDNKSANPSSSSSMEVRGSREVSLYKSRNGEVTKIEHLACTTPEYLTEAGGAMARIFFV
jgi:hypothetical protein